MKLFINHFDPKVFEDLFGDVSQIDFSLFIDCRPQKADDLSPINFFVVQEPNEYFGHHDWVIKNKDLFSVIFTWSDKILNSCENAMFLPFGSPWITDEIASKHREKKFSIAHLQGKLNMTAGHAIRHQITDRQSEIVTPKNFYKTIGDRYDIPNAILGKVEVFGNSMFGVVVENTSHSGYFTEKITDCMLLKTIPIYWGCKNIGEFYDIDGIIQFRNIDHFIEICNRLTEKDYLDRLDVIQKNYNMAEKYKKYENRICSDVKNILKYNNII